MKPIPEALRCAPFTRADARKQGVSSRMLQGQRFVRMHPEVWRHRDLVMTFPMRVAAARLALPEQAALTGISRLHLLGLDFVKSDDLHFVVEGDLHLAPPGIVLHRTVKLAPVAEGSVTPAAAFISYCTHARVIDAIKVGDWLLNQGHASLTEIAELCDAAPWRDGVSETRVMLPHLDAGALSLKESETRAILTWAGLPRPAVNLRLVLDGRVVIGDLVFENHCVIVLYEGSQHQEDRDQYTSDVERYAAVRNSGHAYVQVTKEKLSRPRRVVDEVHRVLVARGYGGPPPDLGSAWTALFRPIRKLLGRRRAVGQQPIAS